MKMSFLLILSSLFMLLSCNSFKEIGHINMISNRNIDRDLHYKSMSTYSGGSKSELKKSRAISVQDAIDQTVKKVPGGEFLMNVRIYSVNDKYFAVEGDVWGITSDSKEISFRGFKVGDHVTWKKGGKYLTGIISALKDDKACLVEVDSTQKLIEINYELLTKVQE